jgi:hypothetical protein
MTALDEFYLNQKEPLGSCIIALRDLILKYNEEITEKWYYRLPCFFYRGKLLCYIWIDKKTQQPYIAFYPGKLLQHPALIQGNRTHSKILTLKSNADLPLKVIYAILEETLTLNQNNV